MKQAALALVATLVASASACAGSVSGAAMDEAGEPLEGVHVEVVYLTYRADQLMTYGASIKATAITSEDGRYEIDISRLPPSGNPTRSRRANHPASLKFPMHAPWHEALAHWNMRDDTSGPSPPAMNKNRS